MTDVSFIPALSLLWSMKGRLTVFLPGVRRTSQDAGDAQPLDSTPLTSPLPSLSIRTPALLLCDVVANHSR